MYSAPEGMGYSDRSISAATENMRWIRLISANALMLLGHLDEARGALLGFCTNNKKLAPLVFSWEDAVLKEFVQLRRAGHAHPLMKEVERHFFENGRVRNREDFVAPVDPDLPGARGIQLADAHAKQSELDEAFTIYRAVLLEGADPQNRQARAQRNLVACRIGLLAWQFLLTGNDAAALACADIALNHDPYSTSFNLNRAHALMFLGRTDEARAIYFAYQGKMMSGRSLIDPVIKDEFDQLRKAGRESNCMSEIERRFAEAMWDERRNKRRIDHAADVSPIGETDPSRQLILAGAGVASPPPRAPALSEPDDLNSAKELLCQGRPDEALVICKRRIQICNQIIGKGVPNLQAPEDRHLAIKLVSEISLAFLLEGEFSKALDAASYAISEVQSSPFASIRRAHALMFLGNAEEARAVYLQYRGEKMTPEQRGESVILQDFQAMREHDRGAPLMEEIEELFGRPQPQVSHRILIR
jgi:Tfp pilus assembly protein PilF